jgi:hypothetical protein
MTSLQQLDPNQAVRLFFSDPDWRMKSGVGGMLGAAALLMLFLHKLLIPVAFCMWALLAGYNLRLIRCKIADINSPLPKWNDWPDLFISGLTWIAVAFGYWLLVSTVTTVALFLGVALGGPGLALSDQYVVWVVVTLAVVSATILAVSFFATINMLNFAKQERTAAAFDVFTAFRRLAQAPKQFLQAWLLFIGLQAAGVVLPIVSVVGVAFIPIVSFTFTSVAAIILAQAWRSSEASE